MDIPSHLQRVQSQYPDLTSDTTNLTNKSKPRKIPLLNLPGAKLLKGLRGIGEFDLLRTNAEVSFDSNTDDGWLSEYYLGGGGFGDVGVYRKRNAQGNIIDEVAVKDVENATGAELWDDSDKLDFKRHLLREAVVQRQVNLSQSESMMLLETVVQIKEELT